MASINAHLSALNVAATNSYVHKGKTKCTVKHAFKGHRVVNRPVPNNCPQLAIRKTRAYPIASCFQETVALASDDSELQALHTKDNIGSLYHGGVTEAGEGINNTTSVQDAMLLRFKVHFVSTSLPLLVAHACPYKPHRIRPCTRSCQVNVTVSRCLLIHAQVS
jgi:hypothetical protein